MKKVLGKALHMIIREMLCCLKKSLHQHCVQQAFNMGINGCLVQWVKAKERLVVDNCTCSQNWKRALCDLSEQCTFCLIFQVIYSLSLWNLTSLYLSLYFLGDPVIPETEEFQTYHWKEEEMKTHVCPGGLSGSITDWHMRFSFDWNIVNKRLKCCK